MPQKVTLEKGTKKGNRSFKITRKKERKKERKERKCLEGRDKVFSFY